MKKALLSVVAIGAVGGAVAGLMLLSKQKGGAGSAQASDLLPQSTVMLFELPNLKASGERWKQTSLYKIGQEPEVKAFMERPLSLIPKNAMVDDARALCKQVDAQQFFVALTNLDMSSNQPVGILGLRYSGGEVAKQAISAQLEKARAKARKSAPAGKAALEQHQGYEIESFSDGEITMAGVFAGEWYFISNDVALIKQTLDRLAGAGEEEPLSGLQSYQKSMGELPATVEARGFMNFARVRDQFLGLLAMSGQAVEQEQLDEMKKIEGVAFSGSFDGELMRDTFYAYAPGMKQIPALSGATNRLAGPELPIHIATVIAPQGALPEPDGLPGPFADTLSRLKREGIGTKEIAAAFGPEMSFSIDITGRPEIPGNLTAVQVKDAAEAERIVRVLLEGWSKSDLNGSAVWSAPEIPLGALSYTYSVLLNDKMLLAGIEPTAAKGAGLSAALQRLNSDGPTLEGSEAYKNAFKSVAKPTNLAAYVDTRALFERLYGMARPMAMIYAVSGGASEYVDLAKLPSTEAISKHLHPTVMSQTHSTTGIRMESTGTVSFTQGGVVLGAALGAAAQVAAPFLQGMGGASGAPAGSPNAGGLQQLEDATQGGEAPANPDAGSGESSETE